MNERPAFLKSGERARLFPVLADTSKEGRTLSVVLACIAYVDEFKTALFGSLGQRLGVRTKIDVFTEIAFKEASKIPGRPDGLVILTNGSRTWTALIEAKVGNAQLDATQIEAYLQIARVNKIDAIITISNQFAARADHHPVAVSKTSLKSVQLFHWSWMYLLTQATLLIAGQGVKDRDQEIILSELVRFLSHSSTGVQSFDRMPPKWKDLVNLVRSGAPLKKTSEEVQEVVGAWHQEVRDLSLILSRLLGTSVEVRLPRAHQLDPKARASDDSSNLVETKRLRCELDVPDTANSIVIEADLFARSIFISMRLAAPGDRKSSAARVNWLLRQLSKSNAEEVHVRAIWPGKAAATQAPLAALREGLEPLIGANGKMVLSSFEVLLVRELVGRFSGAKTFIEELEGAVPDFYERVGQHLHAWQPRAPKFKEKTEPGDVSREAINEEFERAETTT